MRREALQGRAALADDLQRARERRAPLAPVVPAEQRHQDALIVGVEPRPTVLEGLGGGAGGDDHRVAIHQLRVLSR